MMDQAEAHRVALLHVRISKLIDGKRMMEVMRVLETLMIDVIQGVGDTEETHLAGVEAVAEDMRLLVKKRYEFAATEAAAAAKGMH